MDVRMIAHDMRTPLNALLLSVQCAKSLQNDPALLKLLTVAEKNAWTLSSMIETLLAVESPAAKNNGGLDRKEWHAADIVAKAIDQITPMADAKAQTVKILPMQDLPPFLADGERLARVLANLLSNAVKFTPDGGHIHVTAARRSNDGHLAMIFSVIDDGIGVSEVDVHRIFNAGVSIAAPGSYSSGLGLAVCRELVELHGGRIWVETGRRKGSAFSFSIPLKTTPAAAPTDRESVSSAGG